MTWKAISGWEDYKINEFGCVISCERKTISANGFRTVKQRILSQGTVKGYLKVDFSVNGKRKAFLVHRLIALAFIPNPENKPCINHKDGNRKNNSIDNLEWCTYSENNQHAIDKLGRKAPWQDKHGKHCCNSVPVVQYSLDMEFIREFESMTDAEIATGATGISSAALGKIKTSGGFIWRKK